MSRFGLKFEGHELLQKRADALTRVTQFLAHRRRPASGPIKTGGREQCLELLADLITAELGVVHQPGGFAQQPPAL